MEMIDTIGFIFVGIFLFTFVTIFIFIIYKLLTFGSEKHMNKLHKQFKYMDNIFSSDTKDSEDNEENLIYCKECGGLVDLNSSYCKFCGNKLFKI